jgi:hypothetical protein
MNRPQQQNLFRTVCVRLMQGGIVLAAVFVMLRFGKFLLARPSNISDDEGDLLLTLQHYFAGGHLYTQVYAQYGPFYFLIQKAIFGLLHLPVTYDAGRLVFFGYWVLASLLGGIFVYRVSKNVTLASAAALAVMWLERVMTFEPNHPEQMVIVLLMAACVLSVNPGPMSFLLLGAVGAALCFTKINVGIFFLSAALIASVSVLPAGRLRKVGCYLLVGAMAAGPIALMHHFLSAWARGFCLLGIIAGVSVMLAAMHAKVDLPNEVRALRFISIGAAAMAILIGVAAKADGVSFRTLVNAVVVLPLSQPGIFAIAFVLPKAMAGIVLVLAACIARLYYWVPERGPHAGWVDVLKCVAGLLVIALLVRRGISISGIRSFGFAITYALLPLALLPRKGGRWKGSEFFPRIFVTALAAMEILQAYPVAGSQVNIGAGPFLLWGFVCVYDGTGGLLELFPEMKDWQVPVAEVSMIGAVVLAAVVFAMSRHGFLRASYPNPASSLQGTSSLHLAPELEAGFETLSSDIQTNCKVLFTMPGMGGFNFWSGVPTPDGFNMDAWMRAVPLGEQQQTLEELESNPSACVLVRREDLAIWGVPEGGVDTLPLAHYIDYDMPIVFNDWGYEIHVSPQRPQAWVERASVVKP